MDEIRRQGCVSCAKGFPRLHLERWAWVRSLSLDHQEIHQRRQVLELPLGRRDLGLWKPSLVRALIRTIRSPISRVQLVDSLRLNDDSTPLFLRFSGLSARCEKKVASIPG